MLIMNLVALSQGINVRETIEASINKLGGINLFIKKNSIIFIKPDLSLPIGPPVTIQPQVLGQIIKICFETGAKKIYVGFNPFDGTSSKQILKLLGLNFYLEKLGATILNLEDESYSPIKIPNPIYFETIDIPDKLLESDIFISLIAPRTDVHGEFALGVRNYFDLLSDEQKQQLILTGSLNGLLDFFQVKPPQLSIWDAMVVGQGQGPFNLEPIPYNLILASDDLIAGDSVMAQLMEIEPSKIEELKTAAEYKLGTIDIKEMKIHGEMIIEHHKSIKKPIKSSQNASEGFEIIEGKPCNGCQICLRYFIDFLLRFVEKDLEEFGGFTCFIGELSPKISYSLKSGVILFGDCVISSNLEIKFNSKTQKKKFFFKFPGCPPLNFRYIEKFCLDFKKRLPSLEIVEEFIRKWTVGRHFSSIHTAKNAK